MTTPCTACGTPVQIKRRLPAGCRISCPRPECQTAVTAAHNAAVAEYDAMMAARPRVARVRRNPQPLYGDLRWMAALNGIKTDGSGQAAR